MELKYIRIFLGSSIVELEEERYKLAGFINALNSKYLPHGVFIDLYICEETSSEMREGGSQSVHDDYIRDQADAAVFLFFRKAGEYTMGELRLARDVFLASKRPNVYVFFKTVDGAPDVNEEIERCVKTVFEDYGHYYKLFSDIDTVKLELLQFLADLLPGKPELLVKDRQVFLGAESVEQISVENVFAYKNNPQLKKYREEIERLTREQLEAAARGDADAAFAVSLHLDEVRKKYRTLEKEILEMLRLFAEENRKGKKADPRRMEALRLLELGRLEEAKGLIPQEELNDRAQSLKERETFARELFKDEAEQLIEDAKVRIQVLKSDVENPDRIEEAERTYQSVYDTAVSSKSYAFIYEYAEFLTDQHFYPKALKVGEKLRYLYGDPDIGDAVSEDERADLLILLGIIYSDVNDFDKAEKLYSEALTVYRRFAGQSGKSTYESRIATTCNNLAILYANTGRPDEAEKLYLEALEIRRRLAEQVNKGAYEPYVAGTCNNLANLYQNAGRPDKAEKLYLEALEIYRRLAEQVNKGAYEPYVAGTCNNLACLYDNTGRPDKAEKLYLEALEIRRRLAEQVSKGAYEPDVATTCNNLANLYQNTGRSDEAEKLYLEALEIRRRLVEQVSRGAYEPDLAMTCNNLATLYADTGRPDEAEKLYLEAHELYRRLAEQVSKEAYEPDVATTCNNLACLYDDTGRPDEAEKLYLEALEIRRRLVEQVSKEAYEPKVADTCNNLACLYDDTGRSDEAEKLYLEALEIRRRLAEQVSKEAYEPDVADTCNNLAVLYKNTGRPDEAEKLYLEALELYRRLAEQVSRPMYEQDVAMVLENLAELYENIGRLEEAEKLLAEAREIRKRYDRDA